MPTYTNNRKYFGKERIDNSSTDGERKKFNFKKGKKKFKNRNRPKSFKFKKHSRNRHYLAFLAFSFLSFLFSFNDNFGFFITLESLNDLPLYLFDIF